METSDGAGQCGSRKDAAVMEQLTDVDAFGSLVRRCVPQPTPDSADEQWMSREGTKNIGYVAGTSWN